MRYRLLATVALAALAIAGALPEALAYLKAGPNVAGPAHHRLKSPGGAAPPLDGLPTAAVAVSFRKIRAAYAGPGMKLRRTTGGTLDINYLGATGFTGAPLDSAAAAAFCNATTCFVDTWYNQASAGAPNPVQATTAIQPQYIVNCGDGQPCIEVNTTTQNLTTATAISWAAAKMTLSAVGNRSSGTNRCYFAGRAGGYFNAPPVPNYWNITDYTSTEYYMPAADGVWHAGIGIIDAAASVGRIDDTEMPGTSVTGSPGNATFFTGAGEGDATICRVREVIAWDNYALTLAERAALTSNQRAALLP